MKKTSAQTERKQRAKADFDTDSEGVPPQTSYWSEDLIIKHELFHVKDCRDVYHRPKIKEAETFIESDGSAAIPVTTANLNPSDVLISKKTDFDIYVVKKTNQATREYNPGKESRAYADGKLGFMNLKNSIVP
jgi:hypothetical protein